MKSAFVFPWALLFQQNERIIQLTLSKGFFIGIQWKGRKQVQMSVWCIVFVFAVPVKDGGR